MEHTSNVVQGTKAIDEEVGKEEACVLLVGPHEAHIRNQPKEGVDTQIYKLLLKRRTTYHCRPSTINGTRVMYWW